MATLKKIIGRTGIGRIFTTYFPIKGLFSAGYILKTILNIMIISVQKTNTDVEKPC